MNLTKLTREQELLLMDIGAKSLLNVIFPEGKHREKAKNIVEKSLRKARKKKFGRPKGFKMPSAQRKAVSIRMKKYWAARRKKTAQK